MIKPKTIVKKEEIGYSKAQQIKWVMTFAWKLAKEGAAKFGGSAKDFIAASLKKAWAIIKTTQKAEVISQDLADFVLSKSHAHLPKDAVIRAIIVSSAAGKIKISNAMNLVSVFN